MSVRFVLGPAGCGKTWRCLHEIREALARNPEGPPILLLAPKQATFQLERQLLESSAVAGWTRLRILSFERLAQELLSQQADLNLLDEEGRIMVLRALLRRHQSELQVFHSAARLTGFAQELSATLREFQRQQTGPERIQSLIQTLPGPSTLGLKLADLALLMRTYREWMRAQGLQDSDALTDLACEALRDPATPFALEDVWLDGFAEMTPQEIDLLTLVITRSRRTTLCFCADQAFEEDASWISPWAVVSQTVRKVFAAVTSMTGVTVDLELLPRSPHQGRFGSQPALAHLEQAWLNPREAPETGAVDPAGALRLVACADPEKEAIVAAREIWRAVRSGVRFREIAIIARSVEARDTTLPRVLSRYGIPYFIDRRAPLAHHPLAELTRSALRIAAFDWTHEDWFGALKTGLAAVSDDWIDRLENLALAQGWKGAFWRRTDANADAARALGVSSDRLRAWVDPFVRFVDSVGDQPTTEVLTAAIRELWETLDVAGTLDTWSESTPGEDALVPGVHQAAIEELNGWLGNVDLGFAGERLPLTEWLPILDAGLASLTAGVIPPAQDQVLIGAIDRSRQPELRLAIVMGLNEGCFPIAPVVKGILTEAERDLLSARGVSVVPDRRRRIGHERYFGYIAMTRASDRLVLTWSQRDENGNPKNPSAFVRHVQRIFPGIAVESDAAEDWPIDAPLDVVAPQVEHRVELLPWLIARRIPLHGHSWPVESAAHLHPQAMPETNERLSPACAAALHGPAPEVSVSALESMASCPFQFFVRHGLRGREREHFEVGPPETGSLAHDLLAAFHASVAAVGLRWRDLTPAAAEDRFSEVAETYLAGASGRFEGTPESRWKTRGLIAHLREMVGILAGWAGSTDFDPEWAELTFGPPPALAPWSLEIGPDRSVRVRGKVDRVDVYRPPEGPPWFLVMDYKLRSKRPDDVMIRAGVELQLAAYVLALAESELWGLPPGVFPIPAGMFFIGLRGKPKRAAARGGLADAREVRAEMHRHRGRFRASAHPHLDRGERGIPSGQYVIDVNKNGRMRQGSDGREDVDFDAALEQSRETIRRLARAITEGEVQVSPFRRGTVAACDRCNLRPVCRFDAWTQSFRRLDSNGAP